MKPIVISETHNYIATFLSLSCNLRCSYCINYFEEGRFNKKQISGKDWVRGLNRIVSRDDLPISIQGGEPSLHKDFIYILNNIKSTLNIDILTNLQFNEDEFIRKIDPNRIKRKSPYASIRVSYHPETMQLDHLVKKVLKLLDNGFSIGIWGVLHPAQESEIMKARDHCLSLGIDFRTKEFLGEYNGKLYGTYRYPGACEKKFAKKVMCKTTEFIIGSNGDVYRCHSDLYENRKPIGNILDEDFEIEDKYRECDDFGHCNPCDVKIKTNRFQQYGHTSVEIKF